MSANGQAIVVAGAPAKALTESTKAFEPTGLREAYQLAKLLVASRLMPKSVNTPEAAFAIMASGRELGLTAMQSLRSIHIIEGKPTLSADLIVALVKSRPDVCRYFRLVESTDQVATYETHRVGEPGPTRMSFTWADAQRAGVTGKDNWRKYPAAMLRARCSAALARAVYPDLVMGVYDPDELSREPAPAAAGMEVVGEVAPEQDLTPQLAASVEANWPAWEAKHIELFGAAATMGELNELWSDANDEIKRLKPPKESKDRVVLAKDSAKVKLLDAEREEAEAMKHALDEDPDEGP